MVCQSRWLPRVAHLLYKEPLPHFMSMDQRSTSRAFIRRIPIPLHPAFSAALHPLSLSLSLSLSLWSNHWAFTLRITSGQRPILHGMPKQHNGGKNPSRYNIMHMRRGKVPRLIKPKQSGKTTKAQWAIMGSCYKRHKSADHHSRRGTQRCRNVTLETLAHSPLLQALLRPKAQPINPQQKTSSWWGAVKEPAEQHQSPPPRRETNSPAAAEGMSCRGDQTRTEGGELKERSPSTSGNNQRSCSRGPPPDMIKKTRSRRYVDEEHQSEGNPPPATHTHTNTHNTHTHTHTQTPTAATNQPPPPKKRT